MEDGDNARHERSAHHDFSGHVRSVDGEPLRAATRFSAQANALMRKNLVFQKRRWKTNACLATFPALLCLLLFALKQIVNMQNNKPEFRCGCRCVPVDNSTGVCKRKCGVEYSDDQQAVTCSVPSPLELPAMMQVPDIPYRAVNLGGEYPGFPTPSCQDTQTCPLVFLYTGQNRSIADTLTGNMLSNVTPSDPGNLLSSLVPGTSKDVPFAFFVEPALPDGYNLLQRNCTTFSNTLGVPCVSTLMLWRNDAEIIDGEIYKGYNRGNPEKLINEIPVAYDFQNTSLRKLDVIISFNSTYRGDVLMGDSPVLRVARSMNLAAEAFIRMLLNPLVELPFSFIKEMPKPETKFLLDLSTLLGPLFYMWVIQLLLPVMLIYLVYEKERNLRMMMKMHGLHEGPYWLITYAYFLTLSMVYVFCFVAFGSIIRLNFFSQNDYSIQFVFYMVYINLQIALAFFGAALFSHVSTATVCGYLYVFGFGLLGGFLFANYVQDTTISRRSIFALELLPGFSLYRGLYEFAQYAIVGERQGIEGMRWKNLSDNENGLRQVLGIMAVEWAVFLILAIYLDQVVASGSGLKKHPLFFLERCLPKAAQTMSIPSRLEMKSDKTDVQHEKSIVEGLRKVNDPSYSIICDDLKKVYPGKDGNADKYAVCGLSLAIRRGECFGMLGPNGAGKTTSINMMIGFLTPSSGQALVAGLDICKDMDKLYTIMGVCPQHDLLWEMLTGREHLLFYGRLKNLKGAALETAVEASLKNVNLFEAGNKQAGKYSGGMKRRLSVAISLIGDPKAVYMDEPSTGLDPASRRTLWTAIKKAKQDRAIILTTHSMEEAEALCDRVGIFVKGQLQCIGNSKDLKARYGGWYVFTVTSDPSKEVEVANLVHSWSSRAKKVYNLSGTQKFELPKEDLNIARVFRDMEKTKVHLGIQAWGLTDTTLEDVFIKVVNEESNF